MTARRVASGIAAVALVLVLAACGIETDGADTERQEFVEERAVEQEQLREFRDQTAELPPLSAGEVAIAGETPDSITAAAVDQFNIASTGIDVDYDAVGATGAFDALCEGGVDLVEVTRPISETELAECEANGVELAAPLQMASDAIVVVTRNESDVGGDCVGVPDVGAIFARGSTVDNWIQLGFDDLSLETTGPTDGTSTFEFFVSRVFGRSEPGSLADFRADYRAQASEREIKNQVINRSQRARALQRARLFADALRERVAARRQLKIDHAERDADAQVLEEIEQVNRRNRKLGIEVDADRLESHNARLVARAKARASARVIKAFDEETTARVAARREELLQRVYIRGTVGYVSFAFYELFEEQLRPLEIDRTGEAQAPLIPDPSSLAVDETVVVPPVVEDEGAGEPNCIFPSQETITSGQYPLARRTLLYVATRSLAREEVERFLAAYLADVDELALAAGLVPIPEQLRAEQFEVVTGRQLQLEQAATADPSGVADDVAGEPQAAEATEPVGSVPGVAE